MAIDQDITNLPTPPSRSDSPSDFSDKADTFLAALPQLQTELNTYADEANATQQVINTSESNAATSETNAEDWASKTDGIVLTTDYSAKAYAISDNLIPEGAAKEWAIKIGGTVDGTEFSAKKYAIDAESSANAAASIAGATAWSAGVTYDTNDAAIGSDGNTYRSLVDGNIGNDPVAGDGTKWLNLTGTADVTKAELTKTFAAGESASLTLSEEVTTAPVVSVTKEVPQTGVTSNDWDVASDGANYTLHDTAYDTTLTPSEIGFSLSETVYTGKSFSVSSQDIFPNDVVLNNDGTKMYVAGQDNDSIFQYSLSAAYDVSTATYDSVSFNIGSQETGIGGVRFNDAGDKLYVIGFQSDKVYQYTLSSAFDISTASYNSVSFDVSGQSLIPTGLTFSQSGSKLYVCDKNTSTVFQYSLSTDFDVSTASYDSVSFDVSSQDTDIQGLELSADGTKLFVCGNSTELIYQYNLSTAFDISTATYQNVSFSILDEGGNPYGFFFNPAGTNLYVLSAGDDTVYQYTTSTEALVLGTGSFASEDVGKRIVGNGGEAVLTAADGSYELQTAFNDDSTIAAGDWSMFALDVESADAGLTLNDFLQESPFNIDFLSYNNVSFDISSEMSNGRKDIVFNDDGTIMLILYDDVVYEYALNEPFEISTSSYTNTTFSSSSEGTDARAIMLSPDGSFLYILTASNDSIHQYSLSTLFDVSSASLVTSYSVGSEANVPESFSFNGDGSKFYVFDNFGDDIYQYSTTSNYDLSNSTYDNVSFAVDSEDGGGRCIRFNNDGTRLFLVGNDNDAVYQYSLNAPYDLTTISYDGISFIFSETTFPSGISFNNEGTEMFLVEEVENKVFNYGLRKTFVPTSANHTAITTQSTDTEFWTDINSMTADDALNDGAVYYAVSTDDRTTWSIIDDTEGVRNIVRNNGGTWEINDASDYGSETWVAASENDEFYALEEAVEDGVAEEVVGFVDAINWSYDSVGFDISSQEGTSRGIAFNNDGTKMYIIGRSNFVYQYTLSTSFDVSSASYDSVSFDISGQEGFPNGIAFNNDGTKMYIIGTDSKSVNQYTLNSSFDLSTTSYDSVSFSVSSEDAFPSSVTFNNDGTKMYIVGVDVDSVHEYTLGTPFDVSTASYNNIDVHGEDGNPYDIKFNNDGTKMYVLGRSGSSVNQYTLNSSFDLSTASYDNVSFDVSGQESVPYGMTFNDNGTKMYIVSDNNDTVFQYSTGTTTLTNRMDATQLNAVSDANHYTLGNDLDLAITLTMPDGNTNSPTSDGVSINYDANVVNQGAVLGTDYEFDKPTNTTVRVTALSDENFKVRVL